MDADMKFSLISYRDAQCSFETEDENDLKDHHAKTHAAKKEVQLVCGKFLWFDTEEDAKTWHTWHVYSDPNDFFDYLELKWEGPGWYGQTSFERKERGCRCGSCIRICSLLQPLSSFIKGWQGEIARHEKSIGDLKKKIEELMSIGK